jgi:phage terminase Nu1 subunit (DNA packaging protein)
MTHVFEAQRNERTDLGEPLSVYEVARIIGCSAWTVRQKHLQQGLPCFRSGPSGRLTFYRNQVVAWILQKQKEQKGGTER